ncbi:MAG TPA: acetylxylan esterase [Chloroflexi bacterium]|jgi:cephalosporin-C deacetylase|nr:acetylxylan esterase [Chloroflexota bacterium]
MPLYDKPLEELVVYDPPFTREPDFDAFWDVTLAENARMPLNPRLRPVDYPALGVQIYAVEYDGWRGATICGWYLVPEEPGPHPGLIRYHGYSGSKQGAHQYIMWALQGYAVLAVDVRGQSGDSTDPACYPGGHVTGWMTMGILDPETYYYCGVYMDCVRALDFLCAQPRVDASRIGLMGMSQGGGLTLAVAALDDRPILAMPEMPYLCHFRRAVDMAVRPPYLEIATYLQRHPDRAEQVWRTLSYFDNMNLAPRITCPTLMDVGLLDDICPPSSIYATYNKIMAPKEIAVFPYHNHEVVDAHWETKLRWAHHYLKGIGEL